jgi:hydrogenase maturation protein HypF
MAIRKPARIALAYLWQAGIDWVHQIPSVAEFSPEERQALESQLNHKLNTPLTSSMGRLFDAIASLVGARQKINYEGQAAIELEALVDPDEVKAYTFGIHVPETTATNGFPPILIDPIPVIASVTLDLTNKVSASRIAARFHNAVARMIMEVCRELRMRAGVTEVVLSGGVWQNITLLRHTVRLLQNDHFMVYFHETVPPNDGGIALGQAVIAAQRLKN